MNQHMGTGGTVRIQLDDVVGLAVLSWCFIWWWISRFLVGDISYALSLTIFQMDVDVTRTSFLMAAWLKYLVTRLPIVPAGKGKAIDLNKQRIFTGVCELRADLQQVYL